MDDEPEDSGAEIPEWVVTFGDMMSLLLTFFIMLVSLSEIKEEETYQALVDSMRQQFGYTRSLESLTPGDAKPRSTASTVLATTGRAKREDTARGGVPDPAPKGEKPMVRIIRPGKQTAVGSVVFFEIGTAQMQADSPGVLDAIAGQLQGKPQKIEIRGHTAPETAARTHDTAETMDLAYARARAVLEYLVQNHKLEPNRFRLTSAGASEPMHAGSGAADRQANPRVEIFLLDETVSDLQGTADERASRVMSLPSEEENP
ncbi:OmpA/MotB family protein [Roseimaritima sediminicola]|uniref:OmpA/MotB family protein n=1 Tax=Roseimaritima sediminicola TaxID=2662066 RepID=UPI0012982828|nr:OmpA family protein [Roseimaritima sediminicola]